MAEVTTVEVVFTGDTAGLSKAATTAKSSIDGVTKSTTGTVAGLSKLSDTSRRTRAQLSNVSYQLQDIVVQMQAGQKWSVALGQQLPQLASGFGVVGSAIGLLAAIGIPALAIALGTAADDTRTLQDKLDDLNSSLAKSSQYFKDSQGSAISLAASYGALSVEASRLLQSMAELERIKAARELKSSLDELTQSFGFLGSAIGATDIKQGMSQLGAATKTTEDLEKAFGLTQIQAISLKTALRSLSEADTLEEQHTAAANLLDKLKLMKPDMAALPPEGLKFAQELQKVLDAIMKIETGLQGTDDNIRQAIESAKGLKDPWLKTYSDREDAAQRSADILTKREEQAEKDRAKAAKDAADNLAKEKAAQAKLDLAAAAENAAALRAIHGDSYIEADAAYQAYLNKKREADAKEEEREIVEAQRFAERLAEKNQTELDALAQQQATLNEMNAAGLLTEEQYAAASIALEEAKQNAKLNIASSAFGDLASLMQSGSRKMFEIGKAAAIAEATISGWQAAVDAWKAGMSVGGPYAPAIAAAYTAASLAKTGAMISSISSQSFGGGGSTASAATSTAATATPEAATTSQNVAISVQGDTFSRDSVLSLINSINDAVEDGAIIRVV